jgi:hypothetical protein
MSPQLRVPTIALPNGMILRPRRTEAGKTLPIFRPLPQGSCSKPIGRTKKMNVLGHNHIPCIASLPGVDNHRGAILECKNGFAIMAANREINNCRSLWRSIIGGCARCLRPMSDSPVIWGYDAPSRNFGRRRSGALHGSRCVNPTQASIPSWRDTLRRVPNCYRH